MSAPRTSATTRYLTFTPKAAVKRRLASAATRRALTARASAPVPPARPPGRPVLSVEPSGAKRKTEQAPRSDRVARGTGPVPTLAGVGGTGVAEEFVELPWTVYRDDPLWIPEDAGALRARFSAQNPYFERAEARWWCVPGRARLAAFFAPDTRVDGELVAFFGLWETTGDLEANRMLFEEAERWARARHATKLIGPIDFTTYSRYRLAIGGNATTRPYLQEPYNPPTYPVIVQSLGYRSLPVRYFSHVLEREQENRLAEALSPAIEHIEDLGYRFEPMTPDTWMRELPNVHRMCDSLFGRQFAYTPLTFAEFAAQCSERFIRRTDPNGSGLLRAPDGTLAGFGLLYPDWSPLLANGAGPDRVRADDVDYATHMPLLRRLPSMYWLARTGGLLPEHRGIGAATAGMAVVVQNMLAAENWDGSVWGVGVIGNPIDRLLRRVEVTSRLYALYQRDLA